MDLRRIGRIPKRLIRVYRTRRALANATEFQQVYHGRRLESLEFRSGITLKGPSETLRSTFQDLWLFGYYSSPGYEVGSSDIVIDVGANIGAFAAYAVMNRPGVRVYCYEPEPSNFVTLTRNIQANAVMSQQVKAFQYGVSGHSGHLELFVDKDNPMFHSIVEVKNPDGSNRTGIKIKCMTLEEILQDNQLTRCDLLKLDCEAAEFGIIENTSKETLSRFRRIIGEVHGKGTLLRDLLKAKEFKVDLWKPPHFAARLA